MKPEVVPKTLLGICLGFAKGGHVVPLSGQPYQTPFIGSAEFLGYIREVGYFVSYHPKQPRIGTLSRIVGFELDEKGESARVSIKLERRVRIKKSGNLFANFPLLEWKDFSGQHPSEDDCRSELFRGKLSRLASFMEKGQGSDNAAALLIGEEIAPEFVETFIDGAVWKFSLHGSDQALPHLLAILEEPVVANRLDLAIELWRECELGQKTGNKELQKFRARKENPNAQNARGQSNIPPEVLAVIKREEKSLEGRDRDVETEKIMAYLHCLRERVPWGVSSTDNTDLAHAEEALRENHFGIERVIEDILGVIAVLALKPDAPIRPILFVGPAGVGKTSLGKSIANALERKFARISLGGVSEVADIQGHRRTFVYALPGKIMEYICRAGTKNPVFMLDEMDKTGGRDGHNRSNIQSALLEVLDPDHNRSFTDHYLDLPFDLSRVFFIATANTTDGMDSALLDRVTVIRLPGYSERKKALIAERHIAPRVLRKTGLAPRVSVHFEPETFLSISRDYAAGSAGMRSIEKQIDRIAKKLAVQIVRKNPEKGTVITVSSEMLREFLGAPSARKPRKDIASLPAGTFPIMLFYENGVGGLEIIELQHGRGKNSVSSDFSSITQDSIRDAMQRITANPLQTKLLSLLPPRLPPLYAKWDDPSRERAVDGPSGGVMISCGILSLLLQRPIRSRLIGTGAIPIGRKTVLPIGGVTEKVLAAEREGFREIFLPAENEYDLRGVLDEFGKNVRVIHASEAEQEKPLWQISLEEKAELLTIYLIDTPEQAWELALPEAFREFSS